MPILRIAQDDTADDLLSRDPLALLLGMLFDQHMRRASSGAVVRARQDAAAGPVRGRDSG
ncbi:hypothetical protein [Trujillonella humicola]|uniref:hypothetical protein n=1 Tax=Trujillonella humicola TaxID=3383699 RepID=UPI00390640AF